MGGRIDAGHCRRQPQVNPVGSVPRRRMHEHAVPLVRAVQVALGQRRSLVRGVALVAQQDDPAGEPLVQQCLGRLGAGKTRADDHKCPFVGTLGIIGCTGRICDCHVGVLLPPLGTGLS